MKFEPGLWLKSPDIKSLPYDLKGLWIDMLCYMWESSERGYLINGSGEPYSHQEMSRLLGLSESELIPMLDQLQKRKIYSIRDIDGAIYNRKIVYDEKIRKERSYAGIKGMSNRWKICYNKSDNKVITKGITKGITPSESESESISSSSSLKTNHNKELYPTPKKPEKPTVIKKVYHDYVELTAEEYQKLQNKFEVNTDAMIEVMATYKGSNGKKYKSDYLAILTNFDWILKKVRAETLRRFPGLC
jgi:hypothetical protein